MTKLKKQSPEECFSFIERRKLFSKQEFDDLPLEDITIESFDGLKLRGYYIDQFPEEQKVVVIVHGYTVCYPASLQFVKTFFAARYNVLLIDQRAHGRSEGRYTSYGYKEKYDIEQWVEWVRKRKGQACIIGFHGQSLGGGTLLEYSRIASDIPFMVIDCAYSNFDKLMRYHIRLTMHLPPFPVFYISRWLVNIFAGFHFKDVIPLTAAAESRFPILFIHGTRDTFIPPSMTKEMYKAKKHGKKKLLMVKGARHANAYMRNRQLYSQTVYTFLQEVSADRKQNTNEVLPNHNTSAI